MDQPHLLVRKMKAVVRAQAEAERREQERKKSKRGK